MTKLTRFTTQYRNADDRILLTGEGKESGSVSLWLTQKLLLKTIPVLVDWLQKNNPADLKTRDNSAQARAMAQVFSRKPVQSAVNSGAVRQDKTDASSGPHPVLVHSIDLNLNPKLLRLRFRYDDQEQADLAMNASQLRQWLAVLQVLWTKASWPSHIWPQWLKDDVKLVSNESRGAFH